MTQKQGKNPYITSFQHAKMHGIISLLGNIQHNIQSILKKNSKLNIIPKVTFK